jgi:hypothetical protein
MRTDVVLGVVNCDVELASESSGAPVALLVFSKV